MTDPDRHQDFLELRQILLWQWDPLGSRDAFPHAAGEYDEYAWELLTLLDREAKEDAVAAYLRTVEVESIAVGVADEERRRVAEGIAHWFLHRRSPRNEARHPLSSAPGHAGATPA